MSAPVNFNKARKARGKLKKRQQANENASKFGRNKAEISLETQRNEKAQAALELHRIDTE